MYPINYQSISPKSDNTDSEAHKYLPIFSHVFPCMLVVSWFNVGSYTW